MSYFCTDQQIPHESWKMLLQLITSYVKVSKVSQKIKKFLRNLWSLVRK